MNYRSTRSTNENTVSSAFAIKTGLAPDGGLYMPTAIPSVSRDEILALAGMDYPHRATYILKKYLTDYTEEELLALPGVGRKIANLLLGDLHGRGGMVCDTHLMRICGRLGFYEEGLKDPTKCERIMNPIIPMEKRADFCHRIVFFGREYCTARGNDCTKCPLNDLCAAGKKIK